MTQTPATKPAFSEGMSRRTFLVGGGATAAAAILDAKSAEGAEKERNATFVLKGYRFTDQYGAQFDIKTIKGPYMLAFGFKACPACEAEIADTLAVVQQKMRVAGKDIPIVLVTIHPEEDKKAMEGYISSYHKKGLTQSTKIGKDANAFKAGQALKQNERSLHILCPDSKAQAEEIQQKLELFYAPNVTKDPHRDIHSPMLLMCDDKGVVRAEGDARLNNAKARNDLAELMVGAVKAPANTPGPR